MDASSAAKRHLVFELPPQPSDTSCGPTCLHGIYTYLGETLSLGALLKEIPALEDGGTLGVFLGQHALRRGYRVTLYSFNLRVFDPTWFALPSEQMQDRLARRALRFPPDTKLRWAIEAYQQFLALEGEVRMADLNPSLLRSILDRDLPILSGLSSTYLYQTMREIPETNADDDIEGEPSGHFVVIAGYDRKSDEAFIADPYEENPLGESQYYSVSFDRLITAILLGAYTYDANFLMIEPSAHE